MATMRSVWLVACGRKHAFVGVAIALCGLIYVATLKTPSKGISNPTETELRHSVNLYKSRKIISNPTGVANQPESSSQTSPSSPTIASNTSSYDAVSVTFTRIHHLLDTVEPWPSCPSVIMAGGRCFYCDLDSANMEYTMGQTDGEKYVCVDLLRPNCTVLSFGISNEFSFDDAMEDLGCVVHSFDPTMGSPGFWHSERVVFHGVGLGETDSLNSRTPLVSLGTIVQRLGLQEGIIDYVKLDIECSEWGVLRQQLASGGDLLRVRQLAVEFHLLQWESVLEDGRQGMPAVLPPGGLSVDLVRRFGDVLEALRHAGFRLVHRKLYKKCQKYSDGCLQYLWETLYVNVRFG